MEKAVCRAYPNNPPSARGRARTSRARRPTQAMQAESIADAGRRRPAKPQPTEARRDIRTGSRESRRGARPWGRRWVALVGVLVGLALAGCQLTRQNYDKIAVGQAADQVQKVLGTPRYQSDGQWVYTSDDPRDLAKATVWFGPEKTVVAKAWENPDKPWENNHEGEMPKP